MSLAAMPRPDPSRIGRYEIRRERGRGAMGVVYEAHDPTLGRTIALKTIRLPFAATPADLDAFEKRFFAEARIAARLSHPGIVVVHDAARDPETGTLYMALEYLEGRTLAEIISGGVAISWREALRITARIAVALHHAHSNGVVHRDIKPSNIMILADGEPKIMDFGIAKAEAARIQLTVVGQLLGTPLYMSPEQALGNKVDARSDLFSLGAITYALLTGQHAFAAENPTKVVARVVEDQPSPPSALVPGLPSDVNDVVRRALAKDPAERYPDGNSLAEDIEDVLAGRPPRHRDGKAAPPTAIADRAALAAGPRESLLAGLEDGIRDASDLQGRDLETELDTLFSARAEPPPADLSPPPEPARVDDTAPRKGLRSVPPASTSAPPARAFKGYASLAHSAAQAGAVLVAVILAAGVFVVARRSEGPAAVPGPDLEPSAPATTPGPASPQPLAAPEVVASPAPEVKSQPAVSNSPAPELLGSPGADATEQGSPAIPEPSTVAASPRPESLPTGPSGLLVVPPSPPAAVPLVATAGKLARLAIDFEHSLKSGTLRVWLDATLILNEKLDSQVTRKFVALKVRKGSIQEVLDVSPGSHLVTVEVKWDDWRRAERISGNLKAGSARSLKIRLSRSKKDLSLDWD